MKQLHILLLTIVCLLLAACSTDKLPDLPALPDDLRQLPDLVRDLELPDLGGIDNLPGLEALPSFEPPAGAIRFNGPTERRIGIGERIPGTDISLTGITDGQAEFQIAGMRSLRSTADSLDYDGEWPGIPGSAYNARLRLYLIGEDNVRIAGVHQLTIPSIQPTIGASMTGTFTMRFPFTDDVEIGDDRIAGTTYGYIGSTERGAQLSGLPEGDYPYFKVGDSFRWSGALRPDVGVDYNLRMLNYGNNSARVGGVVTLTLPGM